VDLGLPQNGKITVFMPWSLTVAFCPRISVSLAPFPTITPATDAVDDIHEDRSFSEALAAPLSSRKQIAKAPSSSLNQLAGSTGSILRGFFSASS